MQHEPAVSPGCISHELMPHAALPRPMATHARHSHQLLIAVRPRETLAGGMACVAVRAKLQALGMDVVGEGLRAHKWGTRAWRESDSAFPCALHQVSQCRSAPHEVRTLMPDGKRSGSGTMRPPASRADCQQSSRLTYVYLRGRAGPQACVHKHRSESKQPCSRRTHPAAARPVDTIASATSLISVSLMAQRKWFHEFHLRVCRGRACMRARVCIAHAARCQGHRATLRAHTARAG